MQFCLFCRCTLICHTGDCSDPSQCKKKVKLYCPCKRRKLEFACNKAQSNKLSCDKECQALKDKVKSRKIFGKFKSYSRNLSFQARAEEEEVKRQQQVEAERLQREEAERFEAKMESGRQRRNNRRNRRNISETQDSGFKMKIPILVFFSAFITTLLAVYFYY